MSDRLQRLVALVRDLRAEFTVDEMKAALKIVQSVEKRGQGVEVKKRSDTSRVGRSRSRSPVQQSMALSKLAKTDPPKFEYLSKVEAIFRSRQTLPHAVELAKFGRFFDKAFVPRKKRDDSISAIISMLASKPLEELKAKVP